jgi:predicted enzyme related to lactoylglutathione lyase
MQTPRSSRLAPIIAGSALLAIGLCHSARAALFPAINTPASPEHLAGKLVWADLFTTDPVSATRFYCGLLGWTASPLERKDKGYTVFSNGGRPVAGLAPRSAKGASRPARWIGYFAVADIDATLTAVTKDGGRVRAPSQQFPDRGYQAIFSDRDGTPVGLVQSSSGDAPDSEPRPGDWNWFELYVKNPKATAGFYHATIGLDVAPETNSDRKGDFVLSSAGKPRGGIAPMPDGDDVRPSWLGVIRVDYLDQTLTKVVGLGGEILVEPRSVEYGSRFAIISDSTGGTVGLVEYPQNANLANN